MQVMSRRRLEEQIATLDARKTAFLARAGKAGRARDTRCEVLLGAWQLHHLDAEESIGQVLNTLLTRDLACFLERDRDHQVLADHFGGQDPRRAGGVSLDVTAEIITGP